MRSLAPPFESIRPPSGARLTGWETLVQSNRITMHRGISPVSFVLKMARIISAQNDFPATCVGTFAFRLNYKNAISIRCLITSVTTVSYSLPQLKICQPVNKKKIYLGKGYPIVSAIRLVLWLLDQRIFLIITQNMPQPGFEPSTSCFIGRLTTDTGTGYKFTGIK